MKLRKYIYAYVIKNIMIIIYMYLLIKMKE